MEAEGGSFVNSRAEGQESVAVELGWLVGEHAVVIRTMLY
jgi:hypothetical protein